MTDPTLVQQIKDEIARRAGMMGVLFDAQDIGSIDTDGVTIVGLRKFFTMELAEDGGCSGPVRVYHSNIFIQFGPRGVTWISEHTLGIAETQKVVVIYPALVARIVDNVVTFGSI